MKKNQSGFTLIELLVVIIIATVLAAVGVPLLTANVAKAKLTEADSGLSMIRTAMRTYNAENGGYPTGTVALSTIGLTNASVDGHYFNNAAYTINGKTTTTFCAGADGSTSTAPGKAQVATLVRSMDQDGTIFSTTDCTGTAANN